MSPRIMIPILLMAMALVACSDDSTSPGPDPDILLTLDLNVFFMEAFAPQGTVFASDADGNVLDVATWDGPGTIVLKNSTVHPDTISFTLFQASGRGVELATEIGVPVGSVWTYTGTLFPDKSGEADVEFANAPPHDGYRISSYWSSVSGTGSLPQLRTIPVHGDSTDCFVRIDPLGASPVGGWLRGIHPGETVVLDFNEFGSTTPLSANQVQLPPGGDWFTYSASGFAYSDSFRYNIGFDGGSVDGPSPRSITIYTPKFDPAGLHTMFYQRTGGNPSTFYQQDYKGPVPGDFTKMEGNLTVTSDSPDSLIFTTDSEWDRFAVSWIQPGYVNGNWYVEGHAPTQEFALPLLPDEISEQYPDYPVEGFLLHYMMIIGDEDDGRVLYQGKNYPVVEPGSSHFGGGPEKAPRGAFQMISVGPLAK